MIPDQTHSTPLVSIITPTYNHEHFIGSCIDSVLAQTYENWEQIIVDDGSTDSTSAVVASYHDRRIRYLRQENQGLEALARTYNTALATAKGDLIAILEGDDLWPQRKLATLVHAFANPAVVLAYGEEGLIDIDGKEQPVSRTARRRMELPVAVINNYPIGAATAHMMTVEGHPLIGPSTVLIRRSTLEQIGGFRYVPNNCTTDFPTFIHLTTRGQFFYAREVMGYRRIHFGSGSVQRFDQLAETSRKYVFELLESNEFHFTTAERQMIEESWQRALYEWQFTRGRICLVQAQWAKARKHFWQALRPLRTRSAICIAAAIGWALSWVHCTLEDLLRYVGVSDMQN